jgi:hypothetical protein
MVCNLVSESILTPLESWCPVQRPYLTSGEIGATLETDTHQIAYYAAGKKTFDLWNGGLTSLDIKASAFYHVNTEKEGQVSRHPGSLRVALRKSEQRSCTR